jgi:translation initiation factor IF-1
MPDQNNNTSSKGRNNASVFGTVVEALPNTLFRVNIDEGKEVLAYLSGRMRINRIRVLVGDRVEMVLDDYGLKGRIVKRL